MDMKVMKMIDKEVDLVGPIFDSEEDDGPVDMAMVFEAMKHVPLPDIEYTEHYDPLAGDNPLAVAIPRGPFRSQHDPTVSQSVLKRKVSGAKAGGHAKDKGVGTGRISKRLKISAEIDNVNNTALPRNAAEVDGVVGIVAAATREDAAEVVHDFVAEVLAEAGSSTDFSLWTVEDDILLKSAMEAGAAMEALAKGALRFSRRFTVREIRERWRALLYDPEIAVQAAARMVEAEYGDTHSRPNNTELKTPRELARNRRENSIRTLFYKKRKRTGNENLHSDNADRAFGVGIECPFSPRNGPSVDILAEPLLDSVAITSEDMISASARDQMCTEFEDRTFSQMFSLLAEGGIRAVVSAIPPSSSANPKQETDVSGLDGHSIGTEVPPLAVAPGPMASIEEAAVVQPRNGPVPQLGSRLIGHEQAAEGGLGVARSTEAGSDCQVDEGSGRASQLDAILIDQQRSPRGHSVNTGLAASKHDSQKVKESSGGACLIAIPTVQEQNTQGRAVDNGSAESKHDCQKVEEGSGWTPLVSGNPICPEESAQFHSVRTGLAKAGHDCQKVEKYAGQAPHLDAIPIAQEERVGHSLDTDLAEARHDCQQVEEGYLPAPHLDAIPDGRERIAQGHSEDTGLAEARHDCQKVDEDPRRAPHLEALAIGHQQSAQGHSVDPGLAEARDGCQKVEDGSRRVPHLDAIPISQEQTEEGDSLNITPSKARPDCQLAEGGSAFNQASVQCLETGLRRWRVAADGNVDLQAEAGDCKKSDCKEAPAVSLVPKEQQICGTAVSGHNTEDKRGDSLELHQDSDTKGTEGTNFVPVDKSSVQAGKVESSTAEKIQACGPILDDKLYPSDFLSAIDEMEVCDVDVKRTSSSPVAGADMSKLDPSETSKVEDKSPLVIVDTKVNVDEEDAAKVSPALVKCWCGEYYTPDIDEEEECDICDRISGDDQCYRGEAHNDFLPAVLIGDFEPPTTGVGVREPSLCVLNTEDTEIPSLEGALLSPPTSSSSSYYEYDGCTGNPYENACADEELHADANASADPHVEVLNSSSRQDAAITKIGPEINDDFDIAEFGLNVDGSGGMAVVKSGKRDNQVAGSACDVDAEDAELNFTCQQIHPEIATSVIPSDQHVPLVVPTGEYCRQQFEHHAGGDGESQAVDIFKATDGQAVSVVPGVGDIISNLSPTGDMPNKKSPAEPMAVNGTAQTLFQEYLEDEIESEEEMARFSDIEAMILDMDLDVADDEFSARAESRRMYKRHRRAVVRLEQAAAAAMQRTLNARGALAVLYGQHLKYYIKQTEVLMGRATSDNIVDVDLGKEGRANKVSRQQANIKLKDDGVFYLRNLGRRGLTVNNKSVEIGQRAILGSNCLIEVGGMRFIFEINRKLVQQHTSRRHKPE